jgi:hypothetical protein
LQILIWTNLLGGNVILGKGIFSKPPTINSHQKVEFIEKQNFLTGWFGKRRPISAIEVSGSYLNMQKTMTKLVLELGFSQVAQSKDVENIWKGLGRSTKVISKTWIQCSMNVLIENELMEQPPLATDHEDL